MAAPTIQRLRDISRKLDEQDKLEIERREREIYMLLNAVTDMVVVSTNIGKIRYSNPSSFRILGYDPEDLIGMDICNILDCKDLKNKINTSLDTLATTKSGAKIPVHMYIGSMKENDIHLIISVIRRVPNDTKQSKG